jgi:hypothetical protein
MRHYCICIGAEQLSLCLLVSKLDCNNSVNLRTALPIHRSPQVELFCEQCRTVDKPIDTIFKLFSVEQNKAPWAEIAENVTKTGLLERYVVIGTVGYGAFLIKDGKVAPTGQNYLEWERKFDVLLSWEDFAIPPEYCVFVALFHEICPRLTSCGTFLVRPSCRKAAPRPSAFSVKSFRCAPMNAQTALWTARTARRRGPPERVFVWNAPLRGASKQKLKPSERSSHPSNRSQNNSYHWGKS